MALEAKLSLASKKIEKKEASKSESIPYDLKTFVENSKEMDN